MSIVTDSFTLTRTYPAAPERVFAAWTTSEVKWQWFGAGEALETVEPHSLEFRVGGVERFAARAGGALYSVDSTYQDIVDGERIVWTYTMDVDGRRMSVSVATVEIVGVPGGTELTMTEHGAYLDGLDTNDQRRAGTEQFLGNLARHLETAA